jgi:hypothetical protein
MSVAYTVFQRVRKLEKGTHIAEHERRSYAMTQRTGAEIGFVKFSNSNFMFEKDADNEYSDDHQNDGRKAYLDCLQQGQGRMHQETSLF